MIISLHATTHACMNVTIAIFVKYTNVKHKSINIVIHSNTLTIVADAQLFEKYSLFVIFIDLGTHS